MTRASSARRIAAAAVYGGGGLAGLGIAGFGVLLAEARVARRAIGRPFGQIGPDGSGLYGDGRGEPIELAMLGDSSAVGLGVDDPRHTPGAVLAGGLAALSRRPVRLTIVAVVGAESRGLHAQIDRLLQRTPLPHAAVIMVGANDVTHRLNPSDSVRALDLAVRRLRERGTQVVVGTCPDLGTVEPIPQPLRFLARRWSRQLAAAQTVAVVEAGGRTVSLGDLLGPEFVARPREMFSADRFHPSAAGYAQAAAALLPSVCAALDLLPGELAAQRPDVRTGEGLDDVAHAAARAVAEPGTEVTGTEIAGNTRGPRGRWAVLLRRRRPRLPVRGERTPDDGDGAGRSASGTRRDTAGEDAEPARTDVSDVRQPVGTGITRG
jgi:lysophospholipase L1-like esterase